MGDKKSKDSSWKSDCDRLAQAKTECVLLPACEWRQNNRRQIKEAQLLVFRKTKKNYLGQDISVTVSGYRVVDFIRILFENLKTME